MKKIDWYIIRKFIMTFFIALLLIIGIVIIFDISEKINHFVENHAPLHDIIFDYYMNFVPYFVNMFSPLFVFITVIFFTSRMAANSEIIAILSCGVSYRRMMVPYMISALLIAMLSLSLNLWVIPRANVKRINFELKYIKHRNSLSSSNVHYQIDPGKFVSVESFSSWNNTAYEFTLEDIENNKLVKKISAEKAVWDSTMGGWRLKNYFIREYSDGLQDRVTSGEELDTVLTLTVTDFYRNKKTVETLPAESLNQLIATQKMRGGRECDVRPHREAHPFRAAVFGFHPDVDGCVSLVEKEEGRDRSQHRNGYCPEFHLHPVPQVQPDVCRFGCDASGCRTLAS